MASLMLTPENQIQRLNRTLSKVSALGRLDAKALTVAPKPKSWPIVEIVAHLNIAYGLYNDRADELLEKLPNRANMDMSPLKQDVGNALLSMVPGQRANNVNGR